MQPLHMLGLVVRYDLTDDFVKAERFLEFPRSGATYTGVLLRPMLLVLVRMRRRRFVGCRPKHRMHDSGGRPNEMDRCRRTRHNEKQLDPFEGTVGDERAALRLS